MISIENFEADDEANLEMPTYSAPPKKIIEESFFFDSFCPLFDASAIPGVL